MKFVVAVYFPEKIKKPSWTDKKTSKSKFQHFIVICENCFVAAHNSFLKHFLKPSQERCHRFKKQKKTENFKKLTKKLGSYQLLMKFVSAPSSNPKKYWRTEQQQPVKRVTSKRNSDLLSFKKKEVPTIYCNPRKTFFAAHNSILETYFETEQPCIGWKKPIKAK